MYCSTVFSVYNLQMLVDLQEVDLRAKFYLELGKIWTPFLCFIMIHNILEPFRLLVIIWFYVLEKDLKAHNFIRQWVQDNCKFIEFLLMETEKAQLMFRRMRTC